MPVWGTVVLFHIVSSSILWIWLAHWGFAWNPNTASCHSISKLYSLAQNSMQKVTTKLVGCETNRQIYILKEHWTCALTAQICLKWEFLVATFVPSSIYVLARVCIHLKFDSCKTLCDDCALILILHTCIFSDRVTVRSPCLIVMFAHYITL